MFSVSPLKFVLSKRSNDFSILLFALKFGDTGDDAFPLLIFSVTPFRALFALFIYTFVKRRCTLMYDNASANH